MDFLIPVPYERTVAAAAVVGFGRAGAAGFEQCYVREQSCACRRCLLESGRACLEPIELYGDPHQRRDPRPDHDLTDLDVAAKFGRTLEKGLPMCGGWRRPAPISVTGLCRTTEPEASTSPKEEKTGSLSKKSGWWATLWAGFEIVLDSGGFPLAESTARSGRYPKMWDLACWQKILRRPDVDFVEVPMCAFGLGPVDEPGFYYHKTRIVFKKCPALVAALSRRCPGVGPSHVHVALKGSRPGTAVTRCAEAGVYAREFVNTVVDTLLKVLCAGGGTGKSGEAAVPQGPGRQTEARDVDKFSSGGWNSWRMMRTC